MDSIEVLKRSPLFQQLDTGDLEILLSHMRRESYPPERMLFDQGDPGDTMYLIVEGKIRIFIRDQDGREIEIAEYGADDIFGELSTLDEKIRSAAAQALGPLEVLLLQRQELIGAIEQRPQIGLAMMRSLARRIRATTTKVEERKRSPLRSADLGDAFRGPAQPEIAELIDRINAEPGAASPVNLDLTTMQQAEGAASTVEPAPSPLEAVPLPQEPEAAKPSIFEQLAAREQLRRQETEQKQNPED